ncbi:FeoA family protein [Kordiimonas marina]|uniref:FeoA family protein n=1 Tax=Kordiimonas marina TaxID=2872312 RepID=UPI001FF56733|nr:FeoA family protein [Kordiimonas marina]MCJ9427674.1 ferrous iron transport protein A [Kordiimonas marina]
MRSTTKPTRPDLDFTGQNRLGLLRPGHKGRISHFDAEHLNGEGVEMTDRLREMGFAEDLMIEVLHQSPFGRDPIAVRVGSMTVALRRADANIVVVSDE